MSRARFSIIIRTRDRASMLERVLKNVIAQTYTDWQIVLVDQGEPHFLPGVLQRVGYDFGDRLIHVLAPLGVNVAVLVNLGVRNGDSDLIVVLDDDDTWDLRFLEVMDQAFRERVDETYAAMACQGIRVTEEEGPDGEWIELSRFHKKTFKAITVLDLARELTFLINALVYERRVHDEIGYYDESMHYDDWDFQIRMMMRFNYGTVSEALAFRHVRAPKPNAAGELNYTLQHRRKFVFGQTADINKWMRSDLDSGVTGMGTFMALARLEQNLSRRINLLEKHLDELLDQVNTVAEKVGKIDSRTKELKDLTRPRK